MIAENINHGLDCEVDRMIFGNCFHDGQTGKRIDPEKVTIHSKGDTKTFSVKINSDEAKEREQIQAAMQDDIPGDPSLAVPFGRNCGCGESARWMSPHGLPECPECREGRLQAERKVLFTNHPHA